MAHTAAAPASFLSTSILPLADRIAKYLEYRRTVNALNGLRARELEDIGVARCDIADVARHHTYR